MEQEVVGQSSWLVLAVLEGLPVFAVSTQGLVLAVQQGQAVAAPQQVLE